MFVRLFSSLFDRSPKFSGTRTSHGMRWPHISRYKIFPQGKLEMSYLMDHKWTQGIVDFLASSLQGAGGGGGGGGGAAGKVIAIMSLEFVPR